MQSDDNPAEDGYTPYGRRPSWDKSKKYKHWTFTVQGHDQEKRDRILNNPAWAYIVMGEEYGSNLQGPHYQCFGTFHNQRYYEGARTITERAWCEPAVNTEAVITYCKKDGVFLEAGEAPRKTSDILEGIYTTVNSLFEHTDNTDEMNDSTQTYHDLFYDIIEDLDLILTLYDECHELIEDVVEPVLETISEYI